MESTAVRTFSKSVDFLEKWLRFVKYNKFIDQVDIIPFKCPLMKKFDKHLLEGEPFHFQEVYDYSVTVNKPITDIIDLTFTDKYYKPKQDDFATTNVTHHKFKIPGKKVPTAEQLKSIMDTMENLAKEKRVMGVHCTHGINRTGYIICTFMVQRLGWEPQAAMDAFAVARGIPIQHQEYIDAVLALKEKQANQENEKLENQEIQEIQEKFEKQEIQEKSEPQAPSPIEENK